MKLSVSNIAWSPEDDLEAFALLQRLGVEWIELAPSRIAAWDSLTSAEARTYRAMLKDHGLQVSSLQAIYFGTSGMALLKSEEEFISLRDHTVKVAELADALGCRPGVWGAPGLKLRDNMPINAANDLAEKRLRQIGQAMAHTEFVLALEPVPPYYGADYLISVEDILDMVTRVGHSNIGLHLDVACVELGGGDIEKNIEEAGAERIHHFHIAEKDLGDFTNPKRNHAKAAKALHNIGYNGALAIEMKVNSPDWAQRLEDAVAFSRQTYGSLR